MTAAPDALDAGAREMAGSADDAPTRPRVLDVPEVDAERAAAHAVLVDAIASTPRPPCVRWPAAGWISEDRAAQLDAAALCDRCAVLAACRAYIAEHAEPCGVWAGTLPPGRGEARVHHSVAELPPDLDPGQPVDALPAHARAGLAHALAGRGMPLRTIARVLRVTRSTAAAYLATPPPSQTTPAEADRLAARIRAAATAAADDDGAIPALAALALSALDEVDAHTAAGLPNGTDYLAHALAGDNPPAERRRPLALALVARGLSVRAAGALVGANFGTVARWVRAPATAGQDRGTPVSGPDGANCGPEPLPAPERPARPPPAPHRGRTAAEPTA